MVPLHYIIARLYRQGWPRAGLTDSVDKANIPLQLGPLAHLVERLHGMEEVKGSIPLRSTIRLASLAHGEPSEADALSLPKGLDRSCRRRLRTSSMSPRRSTIRLASLAHGEPSEADALSLPKGLDRSCRRRLRTSAMSRWFVYIIKCSDGSLYTGITTDLEKREKRHNQGKGSNYTRARRPVVLLYSEQSASRAVASRREFQIKGWCRKKKLNLIKYGHPFGPIK